MKLKFTINEPGTFFHFLDSISLWDIHTRDEIYKYYLERYGLTKVDKELLRKYIKIRKKYPWKELDSDFYTSRSFDQVKIKIKKRLTNNEFNELNEIINNFYNNIHDIFCDWNEKLIIRKNLLEKELRKYNLRDLFSEISQFYESKTIPRTIYVHLLVNPSIYSSGGGANISPNKHITIEPKKLRSLNTKNMISDICIICHEILHIIERNANKKKWRKFKKLVLRKRLDFDILREAIADTLVPEGYLALKYGFISKIKIKRFNELRLYQNNIDKEKYYRKARKKLSAIIYNLTKNQIEQGKSIFEDNYINECIVKYKEMIQVKSG